MKIFVHHIISLAILNLSGQTLGLQLFIPNRCKTEGRVTLYKPDKNQMVKHHLPFTETLDLDSQRTTVSIGYVSYEPSKYFVRKNTPIITLDSDGKCKSQETKFTFIPTLSWFIDELIPVPLSQFKPIPYLVGPSGIVSLIQKMTDGTNAVAQKNIVHRNIPCTVFEYLNPLSDKKTMLKIEYFVPNDIVFNNIQATYFTVKITSYDSNDLSKASSSTNSPMRSSIVIDYYYIDSASEDKDKFDRLMRNDFNIPLASGCSEFLKQLELPVKSESFSLSYKQKSTLATYMLAYDHTSGLLRKEIIGESVSIWDLNEDLMYHIDTDMALSLTAYTDTNAIVKTCSVMKVTDDKLGSAFRPFKKEGQKMDLLSLIAANKLAYMGRGSVRELPCSIYETIIEEPPIIFALTAEQLDRQSSVARQYIIQFYLLEAERSSSNEDDERLPTNGFWPAQINLYRKYLNTGSVQLLDQLDVYDFFWALDGWTMKSNELFMASRCFDDANKQMRLEMAITFDKIHSDRTSDVTLLTYNKFKLEYDLIEDLFRLFDISKMHMVEYELRLKPNLIDLRLLIADRKDDMELFYFGEGKLANERSYENNRVTLVGQTEESCITISSLISDISLVVYCPFYANQDSICTAVYDEQEPTIMNQASVDLSIPTCHAYRFRSGRIPKQGIDNVVSKKQQLYKRPIKFEARVLGNDEKLVELTGKIEDYSLTHEIQLAIVHNHKYVMDSLSSEDTIQAGNKLRRFDTISYNSETDCEKICNLDSHCRSFSYCRSNTNSGECILSSLDIRSSELETQLMRATAIPGESIVVNDTSGGAGDYRVSFSEECNIIERNYLSYYKQTDEVVSLDSGLAKQFQIEPSVFFCARRSVDIEASNPEHHVAMFAYCESTNNCIMDEVLFKSGTNSKADKHQLNKTQALITTDKRDPSQKDELLCRIYRKKYQTYFAISTHVLKSNPSQQLELNLRTIEECARACWIKFGQVCASFDYCNPGSCFINQISSNDADLDEQFEIRPNCLHHERDLVLDELRKTHLIGRHQLLSSSARDNNNTFARSLWNFFTYALVFCAFIYGFALGRKVNDRLEAVTISRQSIPSETRHRSQPVSDYQSFPLDDEGAPTSSNVYPSTIKDVIKMDVIKNAASGEDDVL